MRAVSCSVVVAQWQSTGYTSQVSWAQHDDIQGHVPLAVPQISSKYWSLHCLMVYVFIFSLLSSTVQGSDPELNDASTYFDLGPRMVTQRGTYYYMCTRNNDFSNRSQKGKIIVQDNPLSLARVGSAGGTVVLNG